MLSLLRHFLFDALAYNFFVPGLIHRNEGSMNNSENYPWTTAYVSAALETDISKMLGHIAKAEWAIENRLITHAQIDRPEHTAVQAARMGLATMKAERVVESRSIFFGKDRSY
jgi:hypothetical protein